MHRGTGEIAHQKFRCYVHGKGSEWEAICTDLNISVQDDSFEKAKELLNGAITIFLEEVAGDSEADQKRFLNRKAPLPLRAKFYWSAVLHKFLTHRSQQKKAKGYTFLPSNQRRCSARNISIDYSTISAGQGIIPEQKEDGKMKTQTPRQSAMETDRKLRKGLLSF